MRIETAPAFLVGALMACVGRSVVVHQDPDDYRSPPAGNSGPRIGCGVIRKS